MSRKLWITVVATALSALACTVGQPGSQATDESGQPRQGGTLRIQQAEDPWDFDMTYSGSTGTNANVIKLAYSSLMLFKTGPDIAYSDLVIEPNIAERWEVSPDAKTYTFHLRKGVKYADLPPVNGRELTAADVKWTFDYIARSGAVKDKKLPAARYDFYFEGLDSIQASDPYTIVVKFKESFAPFLTYVASSDNPIMPHEIYDQNGHFKDRIVGSGPFQLDTAASLNASRWIMKKNPTYFKEGKPYLDQYILVNIKDQASLIAAFSTKQIDSYTGARDTSVNDEAKRMVPTAVTYEFTQTPYIMAPNFKRPPFGNLKVRQAVSLALDRDELIKVTGGRGEWAPAFSNLRSDLFTKAEITSFIKYDPEAAKRLLAEAGYAQGFQTSIIYTGDTDSKPVELIQAQLKKVGINMVLTPLESGEMSRRRRLFDCDICFLGEAARLDLDGQLYLAAHTGGASNYNQIADPKADAIIEAQRREANPEKRRELLRQVVRYLNESGDAIATWRTTQTLLWHPYVRDYYHNADLRNQGVIENVWLAN